MRASGINSAFMQARSLSAGPVIAASSAAGMPWGSEGNAQPASGACAMALPASAPARMVVANNVRSILSLIRLRAASSLDDEIDLNAGAKRQGGHPDHPTGGKGLTEMPGVDAVQRHVITHVRQIHTSAHDILETLAGRLEHRGEILEDAVRLGRNASRHQLARRRILADLTAEIDETAG